MPGPDVIPCWCLGAGWAGATAAAGAEAEAARWDQEERRRKRMDKRVRVLIGAGVNDELAREAEAADLACREEQLQRAIEAAQSEESYRPTKARRR